MKKEGKLLKDKGVASLLLSIEHFNRPWDVGRLEAVLIFLDHSFEMLLKGAILHRGGQIREYRQKNTIGFDACVRRALSSPEIKFINEDQALVLQTINGLRDAAQHHLLHLSEGQLYLHAQSGVTLFRDILGEVFDEELSDLLPERVLPVSTIAPTDTMTLFDNEMKEIQALLGPGKRRRTEAQARLRGLAIVDSALQGERYQPGTTDLRKLGEKVASGKSFHEVFPGIAAVDFETTGTGSQINLRITKKEGIPIHLVREGAAGASVVAVKRVDELSYYSLGHNQLAEKVGLTRNKTTAAIRLLGLKEDLDCAKSVSIGKSKFVQYSPKAIDKINELIKDKGEEQVWKDYRELTKRVGASAAN